MGYKEREIAKELREIYPELSVFESLQIAVGVRQNQLFERAHAISNDYKTSSALEAIAVQLGFKNRGFGQTTVVDELKGVKEGIENVADILEEKFPQ